ncbi:restriction endonuclease subunit S [Candidatus Kaiserbacteria bacterium]|nr:restriction endonuclease subunit S [Candidatus Kaiserbacteria bacterium]
MCWEVFTLNSIKDLCLCAWSCTENIDVKAFKKIKIPLPPIGVQKEIVEHSDYPNTWRAEPRKKAKYHRRSRWYFTWFCEI